MLNRIQNALIAQQIERYLISYQEIQSIELFFIQKELDMKRAKEVRHYNVTVYREFTEDGQHYLGSTSIMLTSGMSDEALSQKLKDAYYAAGFVKNPYYELETAHKEQITDTNPSLEEFALQMANALYEVDTDDTTFINCAEIFIKKTITHLINSNQLDVSFPSYQVSGEFVVQSKLEQDVETYADFTYAKPDTEALKQKVRDTIELTKARSVAHSSAPSGTYDVILSHQYVAELLAYYESCSDAAMIYPNYSNFQLDKTVACPQLNCVLSSNMPYSSEGTPMHPAAIIKNGVLSLIHGGLRFSYYLNIPATGFYNHMHIDPGNISLENMKTGKYLHIVNFSDFQMDTFSGFFGGEIRLAFYSDGNTVVPVTGGSISGNIHTCQDSFQFSKECQDSFSFDGPLAIKISNVTVGA